MPAACQPEHPQRTSGRWYPRPFTPLLTLSQFGPAPGAYKTVDVPPDATAAMFDAYRQRLGCFDLTWMALTGPDEWAVSIDLLRETI